MTYMLLCHFLNSYTAQQSIFFLNFIYLQEKIPTLSSMNQINLSAKILVKTDYAIIEIAIVLLKDLFR